MTESSKSCSGNLMVRRLWPTETALFRAHFDRLDHQCRIMRFGGVVHASMIDNYVRSAMSGDGLVYGAFVGGELHGVGEIRISLLTGRSVLARYGASSIQFSSCYGLLQECQW